MNRTGPARGRNVAEATGSSRGILLGRPDRPTTVLVQLVEVNRTVAVQVVRHPDIRELPLLAVAEIVLRREVDGALGIERILEEDHPLHSPREITPPAAVARRHQHLPVLVDDERPGPAPARCGLRTRHGIREAAGGCAIDCLACPIAFRGVPLNDWPPSVPHPLQVEDRPLTGNPGVAALPRYWGQLE